MSYGTNTESVIPERISRSNKANTHLVPDLQTLHAIPWVGNGAHRFAEMIVTSHWIDDRTPLSAAPRQGALRQLERLDKLGYKFYSSAEQEFSLMYKGIPEKPLFEGNPFLSSLLLNRFADWITEVDQNLREAGVDVRIVHIEFGPGEMEISTSPKYGIEGADISFIMKQCIKEIADKRDWIANFMALPWLGKMGSGCHFNFSVWEKDSNRNAFGDEKSPDGLSAMAHHWIAGTLKHARALTALCCSSTNCYKRLLTPWVPTVATWGNENRTAMLRTKGGPEGAYMENRLPSSLASPYHVMAGTIAAGLDGVINRLECPPEQDTENAIKLPMTLEESLECLQQDKVIVEALGTEFVEWFVQVKIEVDLKAIEGLTDPKEIHSREFDQYAVNG